MSFYLLDWIDPRPRNMSILIELDFDEARRKKYERGVAEHRTDASLPFDGDPLAEAYDECLDLANYLDEMERRGARIPGIVRSMVKAVANWLKSRYEAAKDD